VSFAILFLSDGETYSGPDGHICIFDDKYEHEDDLSSIKDYKGISIAKLMAQLQDKRELLPLEIQNLIPPTDEVDFTAWL
jgi:hypothetical protein